jgi:hypothetical protein
MNYLFTGRGAIDATNLKTHLDEHNPDLAKYLSGSNMLQIREKDGSLMAYAHLTGQHSQCGVVNLHDVVSGGNNDEALTGLTTLIDHAAEIAAYLQYTVMQVTLVTKNKVEVFKEKGFETLQTFVNKRTGRTVHIMTKEI